MTSPQPNNPTTAQGHRTAQGISTAAQVAPASLLGALRIGGAILVFALLLVVASNLVFQKGWIEPEARASGVLSQLSQRFAETRLAVMDERLTRGAAAAPPGSVERAAGVTDRAWADLGRALAGAREASILGDPPSGDPWPLLERAIQNWRLAANVGDRGAEDVAFVDVHRRFEDAAAELRARGEQYQASLEELQSARTWLLLVMSAAGGLAAWWATLYAIRRTRRSLRRIAEHVRAIHSGELAPRPLESFVEIGEVNERLNQLAEALLRSREEAKREAHAARARQLELEFANDLVLELSRGRTEHEVVATFARRVPAVLGADCVEVLQSVDPPGILEELRPDPHADDRPARIVADPHLCLGFHAIATAPAVSDPAICPASPRPGQATLCVPLPTAHGQIGVVHLCAPPGEPLSHLSRGFAETLVRLFAPAMENARLLRISIERGATDPLTGLANRRRLMEFGAKAIALAARQGAPLSVVLLDLDRFKAINDEHGHEAGDRALGVLAKALQGTLRESDLAARIGGDEFALLLPGSAADAAVTIVERVRERLRRDQQSAGLPFEMGVSAGVAELSPRASSLAELLALADRALYDAKRTTRPQSGSGSERFRTSA